MPAPDDLADWSLHCFCLQARATPHAVVRMDNNGRILLLANGGIPIDELRQRGEACNESQLALLAAYGLIERQPDRIATRFPVLGPDATEAVRSSARSLARNIVADVTGSAAAIVEHLAAHDMAASAYAVIFGYALDGLTWDALRARNLVPDTNLTLEQPFWRGSFWAVWPGRGLSHGTNEIREGYAALVMVWSDGNAEGLAALGSDRGLRPLLRSLEPTAPSSPLTVLSGDPPVPVIRPVPSDVVHAASQQIAATVSAAIPDMSRAILAEAGVEASPGDAVVILTHEVIWEVMEALGAAGLAVPPAVHEVTRSVFVRMNGDAA